MNDIMCISTKADGMQNSEQQVVIGISWRSWNFVLFFFLVIRLHPFILQKPILCILIKTENDE